MHLTTEQQLIHDHVLTTPDITMVDSVAGSGKTSLLVSIATSTQAKNGLYLAYNKAIAVEAASKFPKGVTCCTTHSLAYGPTVREHSLKVGFFNYRTITEKLDYDSKLELIELIRAFCLSDSLDFESYASEESPRIVSIALKYLSLMQSGSIECTHEFYLKYFHILLSEGLEYDPFDFIALDEAGDLNPVTLEIFKLLPSDRKIMVGDPYQNIYSFNHTINCFSAMAGKGTLFRMTQSFRVSSPIAQGIQTFCNKYLDPSMVFKGIDQIHAPIKTRAFISRTNGALIGKMIELNRTATKYGLTRPVKQIFQLPLIICSLKPRGFISLPEYKHLQDDVNFYHTNSEIRTTHKSLLGYLKDKHSDDIQLQTVIGLVLKYGPKAIIECSIEAKRHEASDQTYLLGTAHSMKGLEFDEVEIADDLNKSTASVLLALSSKTVEDLTVSERSELNLYYVACSRAKQSLLNAEFIKLPKPEITPFD